MRFVFDFLGMKTVGILCIFCLAMTVKGRAQQKEFAVIAYYAGNAQQVDSFDIEKLTHIIFSFCHLKGNELTVRNARDSAVIQKLVTLKSRNPALKVLLSLGGWGGCETCSAVFSVRKNRRDFARSAKELCRYFGADGIDLDWEYPAIPGFPGHQYMADDKKNFTHLVRQLRKKLGSQYQISFAAGGFSEYIRNSIDWKKLVKKVDFVNLMTYDLVGGFSTTTGHHTALYSTSRQIESIDQAVRQLQALKVQTNKLVIGAAFYGRMWEAVADTNTGLYQAGKFKRSVAFKNFSTQFSADSGFVYHWDEAASAPYLYNPSKSLFVTHDDQRSIRLKTIYAREKGLRGIMFWELSSDSYENGLLDAIDKAKKEK